MVGGQEAPILSTHELHSAALCDVKTGFILNAAKHQKSLSNRNVKTTNNFCDPSRPAVGTAIHSSHSLVATIQRSTLLQFENVDVKCGRHFLNTPKI